jgi:hypothetical protein
MTNYMFATLLGKFALFIGVGAENQEGGMVFSPCHPL